MVNVGNQLRSLSILLCGDFFWPSVGGSELYLEDIAMRLTKLGHRVEIACRWQPERILETYKGLRIHQFRCSGNLVMGISGNLASYRRLVFEGGYDCIFILTHPDNWNFVALLNPPITRPRIVAMPSINAVNVEEWNCRGLSAEICKILRVPDLLIRASESGYDAKFIARLGLESVFIPHAVEPIPDDSNFRERFGLSDKKQLLVMVANFWPVKNHDMLLKALRDVPGDWQLALIGHKMPFFREQRYFKRVKRLASQDQRVLIIGGLSRELSLSAIRDADLVLLASKGESAGPLVILEAMSLGTPWLATPSCNAVHDQAGGIVQPLCMFPQTLRELLRRQDLLVKLGNLGRQDWSNRFTWEKVLPAYVDSLLGNELQKSSLLMHITTRNENALVQETLSLTMSCRNSKPAISVVIPTYNRREILLRCLDALDRQTILYSDFEVIVCDDGSKDGTCDALTKLQTRYPLRCLRQENSGQAIARNRAILEASSDLILILNDDAILEPDALRIHLEEHASRNEERVAVLGNFSLHPEYNKLDAPVGLAIQNSDLIFDYTIMKAGRKYNYLFFYTCNISLRKKYLMEVGLFDSSFGTAGAEDIELGYRLYRKELSVVYRQDCIAWHAHTLGVEGLAKMFLTRGKGGVLLFLRHPELPHHYRGISLSRAREFMDRHERLTPLLSELCDVVTHYNSIVFSPREQGVALSERENGINFRCLWQANENEIRMTVAKLIRNLKQSIENTQNSDVPSSLDVAARMVYPSLVFIKWYYDTLGVVTSPFLADLIEVNARLKVRSLMASTFNYFQRKVSGEKYLYRG